VNEALKAIYADRANLITKVGSEKYGINWKTSLISLQYMLIERYIESTYGAHHVRVMRILNEKGFVEEKEITKLSLLP